MSHPIYSVLEKSGCDLGPLKHPMSVQCRALLTGLLEYCQQHCLRVGTTVPGAVQILVSEYNPLTYEEAIVRADEKEVIKLLRRQSPPKDRDTLIARLRLDGVFDGRWESAQRQDANAKALNRRAHSMTFGETPNLTAIYEYLTRRFLLADFQLTELYRIVDISRHHTLDRVVEACARVHDPTKRHVAYMAKILEDNARQVEFTRRKAEVALNEGLGRIGELVRMASAPTKQFVPTDGSTSEWLQRLEVERELEAAAEEIDHEQ